MPDAVDATPTAVAEPAPEASAEASEPMAEPGSTAALPEVTELDSMAEDVAEIESALKGLDANASPMCDQCQTAWAASSDASERVALLSCAHP